MSSHEHYVIGGALALGIIGNEPPTMRVSWGILILNIFIMTFFVHVDVKYDDMYM